MYSKDFKKYILSLPKLTVGINTIKQFLLLWLIVVTVHCFGPAHYCCFLKDTSVIPTKYCSVSDCFEELLLIWHKYLLAWTMLIDIICFLTNNSGRVNLVFEVPFTNPTTSASEAIKYQLNIKFSVFIATPNSAR